MPDFEALIRHQQLKQPTPTQRLKIVTDSNNQDKRVDNEKIWTLLIYFSIGLIGAIVGSVSILFLEINKFIPIELLKIN